MTGVESGLDPQERIDHHLAEMEAWLNGSKSHVNRVGGKSCSPDVDALTEAALVQADANQAIAHAAAVQAWVATLAKAAES